MPNRRIIGLIQIVTSAICYGLVSVLAKRAYEAGTQPGELLALRFVLAAAILWLYTLILKRTDIRITVHHAAFCVILGVFGYALFSSLFFESLTGLSASVAVLLLYTNPIIVMIGSWLIFNERITRRQVIAITMVLAGLVLLLYKDLRTSHAIYVALALASAFIYAGYIVASARLVRSINSLTAGLYIVTATAIALSLRSPSAFLNFIHMNHTAWVSLVALALIGTFLPMVLFLMGIEKVSSTEASMLNTIEPLTATIVATFVLGESLTLLQICGVGLMLAALVLSSRSRQIVYAEFIQP